MIIISKPLLHKQFNCHYYYRCFLRHYSSHRYPYHDVFVSFSNEIPSPISLEFYPSYLHVDPLRRADSASTAGIVVVAFAAWSEIAATVVVVAFGPAYLPAIVVASSSHTKLRC